MPSDPSIPTLFERGINKDRLAQVRERFFALNRERLLRTRTVLKSRQQLVLDLLPLLFHVNHPVLPGYVGAETPCGLNNYQPNPNTLARVKTHLSASFDYRRHKQPQAIHSIFLMGSCGTVAQSPSSDLDVWLCHQARLSELARELLQKKATAISSWAESLGLEIHIFLMESEQFRRGQRSQLSGEAAGTSQHYLLLDEFYRSAILLAGRYPVWWLVPPEEEINYPEYTAILRSQGFVSPEESIDFGGVADIPAGEFIGAGVWQLYKAISAPYKAILKLLLTEAYAREFPQVTTISMQLKSYLYRVDNITDSLGTNTLDADQLDPYAMVYRKLERYLSERNETARLELVRRAFYFKTAQHLSNPAANRPEWQRKLLENLVTSWQWPSERIMNLDTQYRWKLRRVREEHKLLVTELTESYRFLQDFAQQVQSPALINSQEMNLLGRKLYAAFERKRFKVEWLSPGITLSLAEEQLFFRASGYGEKRQWLVSNHAIDGQGQDDVLNSSDHLCALLCWCHCNGLIGSQTRLRLGGNPGGMNERQLLLLSQDLKHHLPAKAAAGDPLQHNAFKEPKKPHTLLAYANLGHDALSSLGGSGSPNADNAFPVTYLEMVVINSWGEVSSLAFSGPEALVNGLKTYQQLILANGKNGKLWNYFRCFNDSQGKLYSNIKQLAETIAPLIKNREPAIRFVLKLSNGYYTLYRQDDELHALHAPDYPSLIQSLGRRQSQYSPIILEQHCLPDSALKTVLAHTQPDACQAFLIKDGTGVEVFISDEKASLTQFSYPHITVSELAPALALFLTRIKIEQGAEHQISVFLLHKELLHWRAENISTQGEITLPFIIDATAAPHQSGRSVFDITCNGELFRFAEYGPKQLKAVAEALLKQVHPDQVLTAPRVWLRTLSLGEQQLQSSVYLRYKRHLEELLQAVIAEPSQ